MSGYGAQLEVVPVEAALSLGRGVRDTLHPCSCLWHHEKSYAEASGGSEAVGLNL